ncbi:MAG: efflux RND transporter periplasmic adaptor subunit [Alphaproteobacteria bacterium]|nr:efflux RND transporter periplasmic adaptor subunit [Alphaproteobacteria bacterium]
MKSPVKYLVLLSLLALVVGCKPEAKIFNGYVEGEYVYIAPTTPGILQTLSVARGQQVKKGDPLFALDPTNLNAMLASAQASVSQAKADDIKAQADNTRAQRLLRTGGISHADADARKAALEAAQAAQEKAAQSVVQIEKQLAESAPAAPKSGRIEDTFYRVGENVAAGAPVVSLLPPENVKIRFFVPEAKLPMFPLGANVTVTCDGCAKPVAAKVSYIASQSEYTPPVIYSVDSRDKLVFMVEARPNRFTPTLRPGLPVSIERNEP